MILADLNTLASHNHQLPEPVRTAIDWLREKDLLRNHDLPKSPRHDILGASGEKMYVTEHLIETVSPSEKMFEAHRRYWDVQICLDGYEEIWWLPLSSLASTESTDYDDEKDVILFPHQHIASMLSMTPGMFAIFAPGDAHKPGVSCCGNRFMVRKIVVKIHVSMFG